MRSTPTMRRLCLVLAVALASGCGSNPPASPPQSAAPPPQSSAAQPATAPVGTLEKGYSNLVVGAQDSTAAAPGSQGALYRYRFSQILPGSQTFTFQDRDLSFRFRPAPDALYMWIENRQGTPVWIQWDRSVFHDPLGSSGRVAHASTRWVDRFSMPTETQIVGLQRYSDYLLPLDYLVDPAGSDQQLHRPLLPEDSTAPQYSGREFGVDLVFRFEDQPRTYAFRFRVESVIPN